MVLLFFWVIHTFIFSQHSAPRRIALIISFPASSDVSVHDARWRRVQTSLFITSIFWIAPSLQMTKFSYLLRSSSYPRKLQQNLWRCQLQCLKSFIASCIFFSHLFLYEVLELETLKNFLLQIIFSFADAETPPWAINLLGTRFWSPQATFL